MLQFFVGHDQVLVGKQHEILSQPPDDPLVVPDSPTKEIEEIESVTCEMRHPIGQKSIAARRHGRLIGYAT